MKQLITLIFLNLTFNSFCQKNVLYIEYRHHVDIWLPYSEGSEAYHDSTGAISSNTWSTHVCTELINKDKWGLAVGISYKKINYRIVDRIHTYNYTHQTASGGVGYTDSFTRVFIDPADLVSTSKRWGINGEVYLNLFTTNKLEGSLGLSSEFYFLEFYNSSYESSDYDPDDWSESFPSASNSPQRKLLFTNVNTSLFYRTTWYFSESINLGLKVGIGTNLYSDWEQFKRYAWIGVGLELGFSNIKGE